MTSAADPLASLASLPGVAEAAAQARAAVDALLWDRAVRARMAEVVAQSRLAGAWASAALDGAEVPPEAVRDGSALDDSPIGRIVAAAVRLQHETARQAEVLADAPAQALARLHAVTAAGFVPHDELGRPRAGDSADDPLRLGAPPLAAEARRRLAGVTELLHRPTTAPAVVLAAVVHAEVLAIRPFSWGSGLVARALVRGVLAARGVDPDGATAPEVGLLERGRPAYVSALRAYRTGTAEGVTAWIEFSCQAIATGADRMRLLLPG